MPLQANFREGGGIRRELVSEATVGRVDATGPLVGG